MNLRSSLWLLAVALIATGCVEKRKPANIGTGASVPAQRPAMATPAAPAPRPVAATSTTPAQPAPAPQPPDASLGGYASNLVNARNKAASVADLTTLNKAIQMFGATEGRLPQSLEELVERKYLSAIPAPPLGQRITYDATSGEVHIVPAN